MPDIELLLIDGPAAGRWVTVAPFALRFHYRDLSDLFRLPTIGTLVADSKDLPLLPTMPPATEYRVRQIIGPDRDVVHIGWCEGERPDPAAAWRWLSILRPVKVIGRGPELSYDCDYGMRLDPDTRRVQGACACGWLTEEMPSRYGSAVMALVEQHRTESQNAMDRHLRGLDPNGDVSERDRELLAVLRLVEWAEEDPEARIPAAVDLIFGTEPA